MEKTFAHAGPRAIRLPEGDSYQLTHMIRFQRDGQGGSAPYWTG